MPNPTVRFWPKVEKTSTCWLWTAGTDDDGYGLFWLDARITKAHRFAYELLVGSVPEGKILDHTCRVRRCVNPDHLRPVTVAQNNQNRTANRGTKTGVRGVTFTRGKYRVQATVDGVYHYGGYFPTLSEAETAAVALRDRLMTHNDSDH